MSLVTPDFGLLVWMTLIFAIVLFILAKFGFPAITSMVDKRAAKIEKALKDAELDDILDSIKNENAKKAQNASYIDEIEPAKKSEPCEDKTEKALNSLMIYIKRMDKEKGGNNFDSAGNT